MAHAALPRCPTAGLTQCVGTPPLEGRSSRRRITFAVAHLRLPLYTANRLAQTEPTLAGRIMFAAMTALPRVMGRWIKLSYCSKLATTRKSRDAPRGAWHRDAWPCWACWRPPVTRCTPDDKALYLHNRELMSHRWTVVIRQSQHQLPLNIHNALNGGCRQRRNAPQSRPSRLSRFRTRLFFSHFALCWPIQTSSVPLGN